MTATAGDRKRLTDEVRDLALECGFQKVGIARAEALEPEGGRLREWLGKGFHGTMKWMGRDPAMRSDPRLYFEGARTVISVAMNYYTPHRHEEGAGKGKISRYAWGDDYHDVLKESLMHFLDRIRELMPGVGGRACVDTSPVMDKAWAVRAGIGWLGKHTNVITTDLGSWVFLGEIILDEELEYDEVRVEDHCGSCTACLDACPTNAITEPYVVDSNKCISYATIELRSEELPEEFEGKLEDWLYGCDICQDVCPWNRFAKETDEQRFEPRPGNVSPGLAGILEMGPEEFADRFRKSAVKRTKLSGLKRNAGALRGAERERKDADRLKNGPAGLE